MTLSEQNDGGPRGNANPPTHQEPYDFQSNAPATLAQYFQELSDLIGLPVFGLELMGNPVLCFGTHPARAIRFERKMIKCRLHVAAAIRQLRIGEARTEESVVMDIRWATAIDSLIVHAEGRKR